MTSTTTAPTVTCVYCTGGTVWGGSDWAPRRRCLVCDGTGRIAPLACAACGEPLLDGQPRKWAAGSVPSHATCS